MSADFQLHGTHTRTVKPHPTRDLLIFFDAAHRRKFGLAAPIVWKKDSALAARLLANYNRQQLDAFVDTFFVMPDRFIAQAGYSFGVFSACLGKVIAHWARVTPKTPTQRLMELIATGVPRADAIKRVNQEMGW